MRSPVSVSAPVSSAIRLQVEPIGLPPEVQNGMIFAPVKSFSVKKVSTALGSLPHQIGKPTNTVSYPVSESFAESTGRQFRSYISTDDLEFGFV